MTKTALRISKLDAARRQLRTAITLWFNNDDPVSAHTLACAAYEIVHAVSKARDPNRPDLLIDSAKVRPDKRREVNALLRDGANFFKHADRDPNGMIEFDPILTESSILFAIYGLELCGESPIDEFTVFARWTEIHKPHILSATGEQSVAHRIPVEGLAQLRTIPKNEFFQVTMRALALSRV